MSHRFFRSSPCARCRLLALICAVARNPRRVSDCSRETLARRAERGGFFFASSAPLQVGMPIEATLRMPAEVTGNSAQEMRCTARVVHVRNEPYGDGRIGFGAEIEKFQTVPPTDRWAN